MLKQFKLGKHKPKIDHRTLKFSKYLTAALPPIPNKFSWLPQLQYGEMLNDQYGCCTIAAIGHSIQIWTKFNFDYFTPPDTDILKGYEDVTASEGAKFDPNGDLNDNGCNMLDVLNYTHNTGISGHKILGFASLTMKNLNELKAAIYLFGLANIGIDVPNYLTNLFEDNTQVWDVPKPGDDTTSAGGHDIIFVKYDDTVQKVWFVSWGEIYQMTYALYNLIADEAYATLSQDFISKQHGTTPLGFDLVAMQTDLSAITNA